MAQEQARDDRKTTMKAWLENFLACRPLLFRLIGRIVRPDEIEDIVQETFVLTYAAARKQNIDNPRAFMLRTARNIALNCVGRAERKLNCSMEELDESDVSTETDAVDQQCQSDEKFLVFCRAVAELPLHCRRVFILKKVYGLSQQEIATYLGLSPSTVEKHVAKGMLLTAQYMIGRGHPVGAAEESRQARAGGKPGNKEP
ncbi:MAG: RNA polymerase sigma factor [Pseudomonadales bacterium]|nr:RNA polymerase sigma factor [Pseudomonadales bacterium]